MTAPATQYSVEWVRAGAPWEHRHFTDPELAQRFYDAMVVGGTARRVKLRQRPLAPWTVIAEWSVVP